jgi:hypothetical protein
MGGPADVGFPPWSAPPKIAYRFGRGAAREGRGGTRAIAASPKGWGEAPGGQRGAWPGGNRYGRGSEGRTGMTNA